MHEQATVMEEEFVVTQDHLKANNLDPTRSRVTEHSIAQEKYPQWTYLPPPLWQQRILNKS